MPYPGPDVDDRNVLVTGLPRSGTTLACELLNLVPDVVALDEPMNRFMLTRDSLPAAPRPRRRLPWPGSRGARPPRAGLHADVVADNIGRFLDATRASITDRGMALTRHVEGRVLGSKVADEYDAGGLRGRLFARGEIHFDKQLSPDFVLVVKHNSAFAAVLPQLATRFAVTAIVRNPLSIISSWQTVPFLQRVFGKNLNLQPAPPGPITKANINGPGIDWNGDGMIDNADHILEGEHCLVFWLGGKRLAITLDNRFSSSQV